MNTNLLQGKGYSVDFLCSLEDLTCLKVLFNTQTLLSVAERQRNEILQEGKQSLVLTSALQYLEEQD